MSAAAKALRGHADTLSEAQSRAREAIDLWDQGEAATKRAVTEYNAAVAEANARNLRSPGGPTDTVPPFSDPGENLRLEAQEILNRAREQLHEAGGRTAEAIIGNSGQGSNPKCRFYGLSSVGPKASQVSFGLVDCHAQSMAA